MADMEAIMTVLGLDLGLQSLLDVHESLHTLSIFANLPSKMVPKIYLGFDGRDCRLWNLCALHWDMVRRIQELHIVIHC